MGSEDTGVHFVVPISRDIPAGASFVCSKSVLGTRYKGHSVDLPYILCFMTKELVVRSSFLTWSVRKISKSDY